MAILKHIDVSGGIDNALARHQRNAIFPFSRQVTGLQNCFMEYPRSISIETLVLCNATCGFCPYPDSPRKNQKMSSELFYKIIDDLKVIPETHNFYITLSRINEPLMDRRLKEFSLHIQKVFPTTKQIIWSNGTLLTKRNIEWISKIDSASFSISLNSLDDDEHKIFMGLPLPPVVRKLDYLHDLLSKNLINNDVVLYAPYLTQKQAEKFQKSCAQRYPLFKSVNRPVFTWAGGSKKGSVEILQSDPNMQNASWKKNLPCGQWFDLHILANGYVTKCCIDEAGFSDKAYNTVDNNCLDLYARTLPYRQHLPSRITVQGCEECIHLD